MIIMVWRLIGSAFGVLGASAIVHIKYGHIKYGLRIPCTQTADPIRQVVAGVEVGAQQD